MTRRISLALVLTSLCGFAGYSCGQERTNFKLNAETVHDRGLNLRNDIIAAYKSLDMSGKLLLTGASNDIGPTVLKYIHPGMSFVDAEDVLKSAGLSVRARPGPNASGDRPDRYDVYATSSSIFTEKAFGINQELIIGLCPSSNKTYESVRSVTAEIYIRSF